MESALQSTNTHLSVVRITRRRLQEILLEYQNCILKQKKKSNNAGYIKSWIQGAWFSEKKDVHKLKLEKLAWFTSISLIAYEGEADDLLLPADLYKLFIALRSWNTDNNLVEQNLYSDICNCFNVVSKLLFWDFLCFLDDAHVFRRPINPTTDQINKNADGFLEIHAESGNTPPPEEDTSGVERFYRFVSLDMETLTELIHIESTLVEIALQNHWTIDILQSVTDQLLCCDVSWLKTFNAFYDQHGASLFVDARYWFKVMALDDLAKLYSETPLEPSTKVIESKEIDAGIPIASNGSRLSSINPCFSMLPSSLFFVYFNQSVNPRLASENRLVRRYPFSYLPLSFFTVDKLFSMPRLTEENNSLSSTGYKG